jgi:hypothetical protein
MLWLVRYAMRLVNLFSFVSFTDKIIFVHTWFLARRYSCFIFYRLSSCSPAVRIIFSFFIGRIKTIRRRKKIAISKK